MDYLFFEKLGLNKIQADAFLALYKLGNQPASVIARYLNQERTKIYRHLLKMEKLGLVEKTKQNNIQTFFIKDISNLDKFCNERINNLSYLETHKDKVINSIKNTKAFDANIPKITLYDNPQGLVNIFEDILVNIKKQKLLTIRIFASNTYEEQIENVRVGEYAEDFFKTLKKENIHVDEYIGTGGMVMERVLHMTDSYNLPEMPASKSSINIIIVGNIAYFVTYSRIPMGVKIENENLADAFHILFDEIKHYNKLMAGK